MLGRAQMVEHFYFVEQYQPKLCSRMNEDVFQLPAGSPDLDSALASLEQVPSAYYTRKLKITVTKMSPKQIPRSTGGSLRF